MEKWLLTNLLTYGDLPSNLIAIVMTIINDPEAGQAQSQKGKLDFLVWDIFQLNRWIVPPDFWESKKL